jgi:hypothetical protein
MTDNSNQPPQAFTPPKRGSEHYKNLRREIMGRRITAEKQQVEPTGDATATSPSAAAPTDNNESLQALRYRRLFSFLGNIEIEEGEPMDERDLIINLAFKPLVAGLKLRPAESQLILAHIGDLLKDVEVEEQMIIEEENRGKSVENGDSA